jgi:hypothetical protein
MILDAIDRIRTLVIKELQSLVSEPEGRMLLFMPVLIQVAIFPFAATLEVKNATLAVLNQDQGAVSRELIHRFAAAEAFSHVIALESQEQLTRCVERQEANIVVQIPADFSRNLASNAPAQLQVILDGRRSNSSQVAMSYLQEIVQTFFICARPIAGAAHAFGGRDTHLVQPESRLLLLRTSQPDCGHHHLGRFDRDGLVGGP